MLNQAVREYRYESLVLTGIVMAISSLTIVLGMASLLAGFSGLMIAVIIAFVNVEFAVMAALVWVFLQYFFTRDLKVLPEAFTLVDECFLFGAGCYLAWSIAKRKVRIKLTWFDAALILFMALGVLSTLLNRNPVINIALGLRCYLQYVVFYYAISYLDISDDDCRRLLNIMLVLTAMQVPLMTYQYFTWTPSNLVRDHADSAFGTFSFGAANIMGVLMLSVIWFVAKVKKDMPKPLKIPLLAILFFGMILAHSKIAYLLMLALGVYEYRTAVFTREGLLKAFVAVSVFLVVLKAATMVSDDLSLMLSAEKFNVLIENQLTNKEGGGRIFYFLLTLGIVFKYAYSPLIGLGPGMYSSYAGIMTKSRYLTNVLGLDLENRGTVLDPELTGVIGEYGFLGAAIFILIIYIIFHRGRKVAKHHPDPYWRSYASWFCLFTIAFFSGAFANGLWQAQFFAANFWIAAGIMNRQYLMVRDPK